LRSPAAPYAAILLYQSVAKARIVTGMAINYSFWALGLLITAGVALAYSVW